MSPDLASPRVLFVLHQMGTLDHPVALRRQLIDEGAHVDFSFGESDLALPPWVADEVPDVSLIDNPLAAIRERRYDAVVMQMPYDELKSPIWSEIGPEDAFTVYSGYSVWMVEWEHGGHGLPFFERCSLVLCSSAFEQRAFESSTHAPRAAAWSGDPLMWEAVHVRSSAQPGPRILWAPHWTEKWVDGSPGFATWKSTVHDVLAAARRAPDATFVVRGHPLMAVDGDTPDSRRAARAFRTLLDLPNVETSQTSMLRAMSEATALITDGVGVIAYFGVMRKPMAVIRLKNRWPPFNAAGRAIVSSATTLATSREIRRWLRAAASGSLVSAEGTSDLVRQIFPLRAVSPGAMLVATLRDAARRSGAPLA